VAERSGGERVKNVVKGAGDVFEGSLSAFTKKNYGDA